VKTVILALAAVLLATPALAKEYCMWKWGWPAVSDCECRQMGYEKGSAEFLGCYQATLAQHGQAANAPAPYFFQQRPRPTQCSTYFLGNVATTTCR
jgi:hypothetical protein